jgi:hydroxyacylglutathione hydrolase
MNIIPIEALEDNYMYLIIDETTNQCAVVDPVEPLKVKNLKKTKSLKILN